MIILRQKLYSKTSKAVKAFLRKAGNEVVESRNALSKSLGLGNPIAREQLRQKSKKGVSEAVNKIPLTKKELKILAAKGKTAGLKGAVKLENLADKVRYGGGLGYIVEEAGGALSKRPIQSMATLATFPMTGMAVENAAQRIKPYKRITESTRKFYDRHLRGPSRAFGNALQNSFVI